MKYLKNDWKMSDPVSSDSISLLATNVLFYRSINKYSPKMFEVISSEMHNFVYGVSEFMDNDCSLDEFLEPNYELYEDAYVDEVKSLFEKVLQHIKKIDK